MDDCIASGKFAELNCISKKTLRLYREMGLVVPARVDDDTGYCYYSVDQCSTVEMVQQLQNVGVPLAQIKELLNNGAHGLAQLLQQRCDALDEQILELMIARQNATQLLNQCRWMHRYQAGCLPAGDYFGQIIAETPAFHCPGREMLFKLMLPVHLD